MKLIKDINDKKEGIFQKCIGDKVEVSINGEKNCYICKTCIGHLKSRRMPPMSVKNNLSLQVQDDNLKLTELEGSLIAKNIPFQKIYQLPKSRWTALTDKVINIPINDEDIINTVEHQKRQDWLECP